MVVYDKKKLLSARAEIDRLQETADLELSATCGHALGSLDDLIERLRHTTGYFEKE